MKELPPSFIRWVGVVGLVAAALEAAPATLPGAAYIQPWAAVIGTLCTSLIAFVARQHNVTSEQAGVAKPTVLLADPPTRSV